MKPDRFSKALDPDTERHFRFHQHILREFGVRLDIKCIVAHRVGLRIEQFRDLDVAIPPHELRERAEAVFRFLPYFPVVRVDAPAGKTRLPV